jgi:hypothetical protein
MRRFLPQTLPAWVLLVVITGLLVSQVATFYLVQRDRASSNDIVELYRLNERAFSFVQLMHRASPQDRTQLAAGLSNRGNALTVSDTPVVTRWRNWRTSWSDAFRNSASSMRASAAIRANGMWLA